MQSRLALLLAAAGLALGLGLTNRSTAQLPPGGGNPNPALEFRVLIGTQMAPPASEVSPYYNVLLANERSGILRNWAFYQWYDVDGNPVAAEEYEEVSYESSWAMTPNYYEVIRDHNLFHDGLRIIQDYCEPGITNTYVDVVATYEGFESLGTIRIRD